MYNISILTIGDEICIGQIVNTNASWIASEFTKIGARIVTHSSVGDEKEIIISEMDRLFAFSDLIIMTGGLGPTHDDITKATLLDYFDDELELNLDVADDLERRFKLRRIAFTERNKAQAYLPSKCKMLSNAVGTAPGMLFSKDNKFVVSLPGVPKEMQYLVSTHLIPFVKEKMAIRNEKIVLYKSLLTSGIPESMLADLIGDPMEFLEGGSLAFLPSYKGVRLRIGVTANNYNEAEVKIKTIENVIRSKAERYIFGTDDESITLIVAEFLRKNNLTVAVAESCTGGMLGAEFTDLPGSSAYFLGGVISYSNNIKVNQLNVNAKLINDYGAVSEEVCREMAVNIRAQFGSDFGISITGIAGPDGGTDEKPVGTVWIGISDKYGCETKVFNFSSDRKVNRERSVATALNLLLQNLKGEN